MTHLLPDSSAWCLKFPSWTKIVLRSNESSVLSGSTMRSSAKACQGESWQKLRYGPSWCVRNDSNEKHRQGCRDSLYAQRTSRVRHHPCSTSRTSCVAPCVVCLFIPKNATAERSILVRCASGRSCCRGLWDRETRERKQGSGPLPDDGLVGVLGLRMSGRQEATLRDPRPDPQSKSTTRSSLTNAVVRVADEDTSAGILAGSGMCPGDFCAPPYFR